MINNGMLDTWTFFFFLNIDSNVMEFENNKPKKLHIGMQNPYKPFASSPIQMFSQSKIFMVQRTMAVFWGIKF